MTRRYRLYPPSCDPRIPRRRRYGTCSGWPLEVLWWRVRPPRHVEARQLEPGLWIQIRLAQSDPPQLHVTDGTADENPDGPTDPGGGAT